MTENHQQVDEIKEIAEPLIQTRRSFSLIWVVPLVALLVAGWLIVKAIREKGPSVTIEFEDANGLEAGETKIRYKDVEIGEVESIRLSDDASHVIVSADMVKEATGFLNENTRFWVVRARIMGGEVSGLGTLFSGAYIAIDPGLEGKSVHHFKGLEKPPVMTTDLPGCHFWLEADRLGSVNYGSPVYYREIKVGEVDGYSLDEAGERVSIQVFIQAPYHRLVRRNSRFWQSSGLELELSAQGIRVDTQSLVSLMIGGIAFGTLAGVSPEEPAEADTRFRLYDNYSTAMKTRYERTGRCLIYFNESVRGLSIGAPVEFRGIEIGEVVDIRLETGSDFDAVGISVVIEFDIENSGMSGRSQEERRQSLSLLVENGLRAQLKLSNLLTGQLFVGLDYYPDAEPHHVVYKDDNPVIPAVPAELEGILADVSGFIARLNRLPVEEIGKNLDQLSRELAQMVDASELKQTVKNIDEALQAIKAAAETVNASTLPALDGALAKMENAIGDIKVMVDADGPLQYELLRVLEEIKSAARAVRSMADLIERQPESLIRGK